MVAAVALTVASLRAPVYAVAQDGARVAWIAPLGRVGPNQNGQPAGVYTRSLPNGATKRIAKTNAFPFGQELVVAGDRVAWNAHTGGTTNTSWLEFAAARAGVVVPAATQQYTESGIPRTGSAVGGLVGRGSILGYTVSTLVDDPSTCTGDGDHCMGSMIGSSTGYLVRGTGVVALPDGVSPASLLPRPAHEPVVPVDNRTLLIRSSRSKVTLPPGAEVFPTTKGAVVVQSRRLYAVTPGRPRLVPVATTHGMAFDFSVSGARFVWAENSGDHAGRIRAIVFR